MSVTSLPGSSPDDNSSDTAFEAIGSPPHGSEPPMAATPGPSAGARRSRGPLYVSAFVVAVISAGALFVSGYTLGAQHSLTPGTPADQEQLFAPFWEAYNKITGSYVGPYSPKALVEGSIKGMFAALNDPFSSYMTSEEYTASLSGISGQFEGIGAQMVAVDASEKTCAPLGSACNLLVVHVIRELAGREGRAAGGRRGHRHRRGEPGRTSPWTTRSTRSVATAARTVTLSLLRAGTAQDMTITRDTVETEDVTTTLLAGGSVGDLKVAGFSSSAADDFKVELREGPGRGHEAVRHRPARRPGRLRGCGAHDRRPVRRLPGPIYWEEDALGRDTPQTPVGTAASPPTRRSASSCSSTAARRAPRRSSRARSTTRAAPR